jgi:hypothetical protein
MAAKMHGVPTSTLRDRVDNRISIDKTKSGPDPVLSLEEEAKLCAHLKELASVGYGYTRAETVLLASDYAVSLGKRTADNPFSLKWFYGFMKRWPELNVTRPSGLSEQRARCANETSINNYFDELGRILTKYDLLGKPQNIYNIDEKGINTEYRPPQVVCGKDCKPQAIMAERSKTVTIIGAGNALGQHIPPFFIFPGERMVDGLMEGKTPGADGVMTKSGWSNAEVFKLYLQNHFVQYVQGRDQSETLLVLYDGHKSHISLDLVEWAQENNIILFVLPPHTSHLLQPMDVGCFGPLQVKYNQECTTFGRLNHRLVTKYDICALACRAYTAAMNHSNLQSAFRRAGIYPFVDGKSMCESLGKKIAPSVLYQVSHENPIDTKPNEQNVDDFFGKRKGVVVEKLVKKRRSVNSVVGGKALEGVTVEKLKTYVEESGCKQSAKSKKNVKSPKTQDCKGAVSSLKD